MKIFIYIYLFINVINVNVNIFFHNYRFIEKRRDL